MVDQIEKAEVAETKRPLGVRCVEKNPSTQHPEEQTKSGPACAMFVSLQLCADFFFNSN